MKRIANQGLFMRLGLCMVFTASAAMAQVAVNLSGIVSDSIGTPLAGVTVKLEGLGLTATSGANGAFVLTSNTSSAMNEKLMNSAQEASSISLRSGYLFMSLDQATEVKIEAYGLDGKLQVAMQRKVDAGSRSLELPALPTGVGFFKVKAGNQVSVFSGFALSGHGRSSTVALQNQAQDQGLAKSAKVAAVLYDVITATKEGYQKAYVSIGNSEGTDIRIKMLKTTTSKFSFFLTSLAALQELSKSNNGFGGDFRFGETGVGAGLRGADKICGTIAEKSMPGSSVKGWRAFLSVTDDGTGKPVNAIDRVGSGPWYDRLGRLLAPTKADLPHVRPQNGDLTIQNDMPNEHGIPNHRPDPSGPLVDNHHVVTGSNASGNLASATATCKDWTTAEGTSANGRPMCGFAWPRGGAGSTGSGSNWITTFSAAGCAAGYHFDSTGGQASASGSIIGSNGGYGGFYCFALNP